MQTLSKIFPDPLMDIPKIDGLTPTEPDQKGITEEFEPNEALSKAVKLNDLKMLHMFWKQGIQGNHPYLKELYADFELGYFPG